MLYRKTVTDDDANIPMSSAELEYSNNCLERDKQYVKLLEDYVMNQRRIDWVQLLFKILFFAVVCAVFILVTVWGGLTILNISKRETISWQDFGAALTGLGSIFSVIMVLPTKIAEHLFPAGGNQESMDFIKSMQAYDLSRNDTQDNEDDELVVQVPEASAKDFTVS